MVHCRKQISNSCVLVGIVGKKGNLMSGHHVLKAGKRKKEHSKEHSKDHIRALSPWQQTMKLGNSTEGEV